MNSVIKADNLSKSYRLGMKQADGYTTLREALMHTIASPFKRMRALAPLSNSSERGHQLTSFFALDNVSFEIKPGEVVGIIGRNGAGKSTILKILSRVTEPTSGRVVVRGRIGSLLEVGTGFHPELTGRENIFLNGSILGMSREEIKRQFDGIVAFAEIDQFLDTPVKRYSSGMYVRLAFAIAAHLNPEILIVDEVLAVGDTAFQKKCLSKMEEVSDHGRTVLFVSHNMGVIQRLCNRGILMSGGKVAFDGDKREAIAHYMAGDQERASSHSWIDVSTAPRRGSGQARFKAIQYRVENNLTANQPYPDGPIDLGLLIDSDAERKVGSLGLLFLDRYGTRLVNADTVSLAKEIVLKKGSNEVWITIDSLHLNPGTYNIGLWLANYPLVFDHLESSIAIEVMELQEDGFGKRPPADGLVTCPFMLHDAPGVH
jgi:ABC-type polysaccharide/polyol phosphate transport system ATPase subunit